MLKRNASFFVFLQSLLDVGMAAAVWIAVYFIRFKSGLFDTPKGIPELGRHVSMTLPVSLFVCVGCVWAGLYRTKRLQNFLLQARDIIKATVMSGVMILVFFYYSQDGLYSRKLLVLFVPILCAALMCCHIGAMIVLRNARRKGYNLRHCAIIGSGKRGQQLFHDMESLSWLGIKCQYFIDDNSTRIGKAFKDVPIYGPVSDTLALLEANPVDEVYLTLSGDMAAATYPMLERLQSRGVTIRIVPDWGNLTSTHTTVTSIGSQLLFCAADSPLQGYMVVLKEVFDRIVSLCLIVLLAIPMVIIAILIKITSRGPVLYRQVRVGMDQQEFCIFKFRTMYTDAESKDGPKWAKPDDDRRTALGSFLRKTSLDELPQLFNVLRGEMSLVGPRPERPMFVSQFSQEFKDYMLRHKVKAGMTGWAQIHGFRGDTSLKKRLQYDLFYVRNWSLSLDIWILLRTPWQIAKGKNAY